MIAGHSVSVRKRPSSVPRPSPQISGYPRATYSGL